MKASKENLYEHVEYLTSVSPARNSKHLQSLKKVSQYIFNEFERAGARPSKQTWKADGNEYENVIAVYNPEGNTTLVVGAHYDVAGNQPGADDNASAVAGLLELIRMVYAYRPSVNYRIEFVAYCLEEPPYFGTKSMGSYIHAKSLFDRDADVMGMICLEMIGYFSDESNSQQYPSPELAKIYPSTANFIVVVGIEKHKPFNMKFHSLMSRGSKIDVQVISFPSDESLAGLSDHRNYWHFGYPALMINDTSFVRNPNYHTNADTIDTLDFAKMTEVVNSAYKGITGLY